MSKATELWNWSLRYWKVRALPYGLFPFMAYVGQAYTDGLPSLLVWDWRLNWALRISMIVVFGFLVIFVGSLAVRAVRGPNEDG